MPESEGAGRLQRAILRFGAYSRTRHTLGRSGYTVRLIRAALVDTETSRVIRTAEWELPDRREYLWLLAEGRVLIHVGAELRVYGEGLKIWNRIPWRRRWPLSG